MPVQQQLLLKKKGSSGWSTTVFIAMITTTTITTITTNANCQMSNCPTMIFYMSNNWIWFANLPVQQQLRLKKKHYHNHNQHTLSNEQLSNHVFLHEQLNRVCKIARLAATASKKKLIKVVDNSVHCHDHDHSHNHQLSASASHGNQRLRHWL